MTTLIVTFCLVQSIFSEKQWNNFNINFSLNSFQLYFFAFLRHQRSENFKYTVNILMNHIMIPNSNFTHLHVCIHSCRHSGNTTNVEIAIWRSSLKSSISFFHCYDKRFACTPHTLVLMAQAVLIGYGRLREWEWDSSTGIGVSVCYATLDSHSPTSHHPNNTACA